MGSEAKRVRPGSDPVLASGSALGVLPSRAVSSAQAVVQFGAPTPLTQPPGCATGYCPPLSRLF
jgi:hypothetical protein